MGAPKKKAGKAGSGKQTRLPKAYRVQELWDAAQQHYPGAMDAQGGLPAAGGSFNRIRNLLSKSRKSQRFVKPTERSWASHGNPWLPGGYAYTYKGLWCHKPPSDLFQYTRLIWELQPRSIVEFGALQGGSAVWLADQGVAVCDDPPTVHSFDFHVKVISPAAAHPRIQFHEIDLRDAANLKEDLFQSLPHPWLVIDDAHMNVLNVFLALDRFLHSGDYYVIEDVSTQIHLSKWAKWARAIEEQGYLVDADYADGFGPNFTCAVNGWFRKS